MAINFPANPIEGQEFSTGAVTYIFSGGTWKGKIVIDQYRSNDYLTYQALKFTVQNSGINVYSAPSVLNFVGNAVSVTNTGSAVTITISAESGGGGGGGTGSETNTYLTYYNIVSNTETRFTVDKTFENDVYVLGNLILLGNTFIANVESLVIQDNTINLNHQGSNATAVNAGIHVEGDNGYILGSFHFNNSSTSGWRLGKGDLSLASSSADDVARFGDFRANDWITYQSLRYATAEVTDNTAPVSVGNGALWWNAADGTLYVRYQDGDSDQWVSAIPLPETLATVQITDNVAPTASNGALWWNSADGVLYVRYEDGDSAQWVAAFPAYKDDASNVFNTISIAGQPNIVAQSPNDNIRLVAGNYTSLTSDGSNVTIGTTLPTFSSINIAGQSAVVADSAYSNLALIAGTLITLTSNTSNDSITITSTAASTGKAIAMAIVFGG